MSRRVNITNVTCKNIKLFLNIFSNHECAHKMNGFRNLPSPNPMILSKTVLMLSVRHSFSETFEKLFLKFLLDTCPFFGPLFRRLVTSPLGRDVHRSNIHSLVFPSGATPLPVYMASIVASHMHVSPEVGCRTWTQT